MINKTEFKETELGMIPKNWKIEKIDNLCNVLSSKRIFYNEYVNSGVPFYRSKEIIEKSNGNNISTELYITDEKFNEIKTKFGVPNEGDLLLTSVGTLGVPYVVKITDKFYFKDGNLTWFKDFNNLNSIFLYYWLISENGKNSLNQVAIGSTQKALTIRALKTLKLPIPPLQEQKAIAKILSDLDEKIEINRKINENLEELGQTLFKRWFIDFEFPNEQGEPYSSSGGEMIDSELGDIPKGWKVDKLGKYVNSINGYSYKGIELQPSNDALVTLKNFDRTGGFRYDGFKEIKGSNYKDVQKVFAGDLVVAHTDLTTNAEVLGNPAIVPKSKYENMVISMDLVKVIPKDNIFTIPFLYFLMRNPLFKGHCLGYSNGTTVLHLKKTAIPEFKLVVPSIDVITKYSQLTKNIINQIIDLTEEIQSLQQIRDSLLPKLMSGQIRVK